MRGAPMSGPEVSRAPGTMGMRRVREAVSSRTAVAVAVAVTLLVSAGCSFDGVQNMSVPGVAGTQSGAYTLTATLPTAGNITVNAPVMMNDATVGSVGKLRVTTVPSDTAGRESWQAEVTLRLKQGGEGARRIVCPRGLHQRARVDARGDRAARTRTWRLPARRRPAVGAGLPRPAPDDPADIRRGAECDGGAAGEKVHRAQHRAGPQFTVGGAQRWWPVAGRHHRRRTEQGLRRAHRSAVRTAAAGRVDDGGARRSAGRHRHRPRRHQPAHRNLQRAAADHRAGIDRRSEDIAHAQRRASRAGGRAGRGRQAEQDDEQCAEGEFGRHLHHAHRTGEVHRATGAQRAQLRQLVQLSDDVPVPRGPGAAVRPRRLPQRRHLSGPHVQPAVEELRQDDDQPGERGR
ncbi:MCE family protein [Gordonia pseudamarae]|uniref:MCE family protein n=1 Tax=Gordonia pseudamarae TaxID=2831662 RepID=A0ABX6IQH8_9ACTN|nr:MCE family protein [Gordonia pseudamarae]